MRARRLAASVWHRCAAPFGSRTVERMILEGFPPDLAIPFRFLFGRPPSPEALRAADAIEEVRAEIARRTGPYTMPVTSTSHGQPPRWPWLADRVSVTRRWGQFLQLCVEAAGARAALELGSCVGISGAYLAAAASRPRLVTIEASPELATVARTTLHRFAADAEVLQGMFDDRLADALRTTFGFAFVDGHHDGAATIRYVETIMPHLTGDAWIVLDDIRLYDEMTEAWRTMQGMAGIAYSVDVGRFGILIRGAGESKRYDLSRYTGWWRAGGRRVASQRRSA